MRRGRPREFDVDKALDRAMRVFWKKGYEGASLPDLTKAMGINRPSLYAAFGNKESLFRKALDRYAAEQGPIAQLRRALEEPTALRVARAWLSASAESLSCPKNPRGCFIIQGALACGDAGEPIRKELVNRRKQGEAALQERFARAITEGDLPKGIDAADLARYIATLTSGMSVQTTNGASRADLLAVVETAMRAWPTNGKDSKNGKTF